MEQWQNFGQKVRNFCITAYHAALSPREPLIYNQSPALHTDF